MSENLLTVVDREIKRLERDRDHYREALEAIRVAILGSIDDRTIDKETALELIADITARALAPRR